MKKSFKEFYPLTKHETEKLRRRCVFIFDTSFLLNLYGRSEKTTNKILNILKDLKKKNRIWIPHQFAYEYQKNRIGTIRGLQKSCDQLLQKIVAKDSVILEIKKTIKEKNKFYESLYGKDTIRNELTTIFDSNIGNKLDKPEEQKIINEAQERYNKEQPPGCEDYKNKKTYERYGDLLGWQQIIKYAKENKKPVVFITDDIKDWCWATSDKEIIIGSHPQLIKEIKKEAGVLFSVYNTEGFINFIGKKVSKDINDEIKESSKKRYIEEEEVVATTPLEDESVSNLSSSDIDAIKNEDVGKSSKK